jgi:DNA-binding GntR family transcriptional regulator
VYEKTARRPHRRTGFEIVLGWKNKPPAGIKASLMVFTDQRNKPDVGPIRHRSMTDQVASRIRRMIFAHELAPGERVTQADLAALLGVSTMPIREALVRLVSEGLVIAHGNRAFVVAQIDEATIRDIFWLHSVVAAEITGRAWDNRSEDLLKRMTSLHETYCSVEPPTDFGVLFEINWQFHALVNAAANSPALISALKRGLTYFPESAFHVKGWREIAVRWQRSLMREFKEGDRRTASAVAVSCIEKTADIFINDVWRTS